MTGVLTPNAGAGKYAQFKLSSSAQSNCPEHFDPGLHAILRATVAANAPAGDYALSISNETVGHNFTPTECRSKAGQMHWNGIVRIVQ